MITESPGQKTDRLFYLLLLIGIVANATGLFNEIPEPDAALYAGIAKRIALTNDWINLYGDGYDWLDKPHFPFWVTAASFKLFGINAFAYKLPAFLFWLGGLRFTWLLCRSIFGKPVAQLAVIIYATALHVVIANFDVRAEPFLTCCIAGSTYFIYMADKKEKIIYLLAAALFMACAVMTKGIFVVVTIAGGFVIYWIGKKEWRQFINYKWWLLLLLTIAFILPELYCLYVQFDLHPEKNIFGRTNVSGIRFFFWDSQFGRFFNSGPIKGKGDYTFFLHTTLWAFFPWAFLFCIAVFKQCNRKLFTPHIQWVIYGSAVITFLLFSLSGFQLPHYIVIIFPHFSILTAAYLYSIRDKIKLIGNLIVVQSLLIAIAGILLTGLILVFGFRFEIAGAALVIVATILLLLFFRKPVIENILIKSSLSAVLLYLFLNLFFYPRLLEYQAGMMAGKMIQKEKMQGPAAMYRNFSYSFVFYTPGIIMQTDDLQKLEQFVSGKEVLLYTAKENLKELGAEKYSINVLKEFYYYPVSRLSFKFLHYKTRQEQVNEMVLVKIAKR